MKAILAGLLALTVLAGVAGTSFAADDFPEGFWKQQQQNLP
jgi:hypothetical protein